MFVRKRVSPHDKNKFAVQIVESVRAGNKVSQTIVRHVGVAKGPEELKKLMNLAQVLKKRLENEKKPSFPKFDPEKILKKKSKKLPTTPVHLEDLREEFRMNQGILDIFGTLYDQLKFHTVFKGRFSKVNNSILKSCVIARIANPSSKLKTSALLEEDFAIRLPVDKIYRMMTQLEKHSNIVKKLVRNATLDLLNQKVEILFFDVTTLYFESFTEDELRAFGFSKDCKFKEVQIVFALITTTDGLPITYKVFPGNTMEIQTLIPVIKDLKKEFDIHTIKLVADRGMFCEKNLQLLEAEKINYVVAAKLRSMNQKTKEKILSIHQQIGKNHNLNIKEMQYKGRRLVIVYSPARAAKDKKDRERLLTRLNKIIDKDGTVFTKKLIKNNGTRKYLKFKKSQKEKATLNEKKIEEDALWDGVYGYMTNSIEPAEKVIQYYKRLWEIEESFRINKHDLKVRPIFHYKEGRILAHLDICFMTYALVRQLMYRFEVQQQGEAVSFAQIRNALLKVQASILVHQKTNDRFVIPSAISPMAKKIYHLFHMKKSIVPYKI